MCKITDIGVKCEGSVKGSSICIAHDKLLDLWITYGGFRLYDGNVSNTTRMNTFINDLKALKNPVDLELKDLDVNMTINIFKRQFKSRGW
jgi:hypothetical protein